MISDLMFGKVTCPHCSCENELTVSWRYNQCKRTKCTSCGKVFWFEKEDMHEEKVATEGAEE